MTTTQTAPTTDTLVVIPPTATPTQEITPKPRHTKALVVGGVVAALLAVGAGAGVFALTRDDAPPATTPTVGSVEDDSAVVHGGAGRLATVDGLTVGTSAAQTGTGPAPTGPTDPSIAHGSGDGVVTSTGPVHG